MTWISGFPAPLLQYPAIGLSNTGFENELTPANWLATGSAARDTSVFKRGAASLKLNPAAATGYVEQTAVIADISGWKVTGNLEPWYVYFWARNDSKTASPSLTVTVEMRNSSHVAVSSQFTPQTFTLGTDITTDTTWRLYRAGPFTPTTYTAVTEMYVKVGLLSSCTAVLYLDEVVLCHAMDGQDFAEPLFFVTDFEIQKQYEGVVNRMEDGSVEGTQFTQGLFAGKWQTSPFSSIVDVTRYNNFFDYISDGTPYRIFNNQNDYTRDFIDSAKCLQNPNSGLNQIQQTPYYEASQVWEEVIREPRTPVQIYIKISGLIISDLDYGSVATEADEELNYGSVTEVASYLLDYGSVADTSTAGDVYLTTGAIAGLSGPNVYPLLDPKTVKISGQKINTLDGTTDFPVLSFSVIDSDWAMTTLVKDNITRIYSAEVQLFDGAYGTEYGDFEPHYTGYVGDFTGGADLTVNFFITSTYERLQKPVTPITGGGEIRTEVSNRGLTIWAIKSPTNLNVFVPENVAVNGGFETGTVGATPTSWTDDGSNKLWKYTVAYPATDDFKAYAGSSVLRNSDATGVTTQRVITQDYNGVKRGSTWSLSVAILSDDVTGGADGTFELKIYGLDSGGTPIAGEVATTGVTVRPDDRQFPFGGFTAARWVNYSVAYEALHEDVEKIRISIGLTQNTYLNRRIAADGVSLSIALLGYVDREVVAINNFVSRGPDTGNLYISTRGTFGTHPSTHQVGSQIVFFTPLRGHVCDVIRRLITTTAAGTNGEYDAGDGVGLGDYFSSDLLNNTVFDTEKAYTYTGAVPTLQSYDFSKYYVDIRFDSRCESLLELLFDLCRAFYANLYVDNSGLLCIHFHRGLEETDSSTMTPASLINEGRLFPYSFNRSEIINQVRYRMDHEPSSETDSQGSSRGGGTKFLSELVFTEANMGDDGSASTPTSLTRAGLYEKEIETRAVRGSGSTRFGVASYLYGDQIAYEVARRIITRNRFPSQLYKVKLPYSKRDVGILDLPEVTSNAMQDITSSTSGPPTRADALMMVEEQEIDYGAARVSASIRCLSDIADIPNTAVAAAPPQPFSGHWKLYIPPTDLTAASTANPSAPADQFTTIGEQLKELNEYPRGYANVGLVTLYYPAGTAYNAASTYNVGDLVTAANPYATAINGISNPHNTGVTQWMAKQDGLGAGDPADNPATAGQGLKWTNDPTVPNFTDYLSTRIYAVANGTAYSGSAPADADYKLVAELFGETHTALILFWGGLSGGNQTLWVKIKYVNTDRVESAFSDAMQVITKTTAVFRGSRNVKSMTSSIGADGVRDIYGYATTRW